MDETTETVEVEETETEEVQVQTEEPLEETQEENQEEQTEEKPKKSAKDRKAEIGKKIWEMRETERRVAKEKAELAEERKKLEELRQKQIVPPKEDDFDDVEKFQEANQAYQQQMINQQAQKIAQQKIEDAKKEEQTRKIELKYEMAKEDAVKKDPSFITHEMRLLQMLNMYGKTGLATPIASSDKSTEIVTYLGKNPEELEQLCQMDPQNALKKLHILEYKMENATKKPAPKTDGPISKPRGDTGGAGKDLGSMSYKDFEAYRNKQEAGR